VGSQYQLWSRRTGLHPSLVTMEYHFFEQAQVASFEGDADSETSGRRWMLEPSGCLCWRRPRQPTALCLVVYEHLNAKTSVEDGQREELSVADCDSWYPTQDLLMATLSRHQWS
jgi:hypothetical protein